MRKRIQNRCPLSNSAASWNGFRYSACSEGWIDARCAAGGVPAPSDDVAHAQKGGTLGIVEELVDPHAPSKLLLEATVV